MCNAHYKDSIEWKELGDPVYDVEEVILGIQCPDNVPEIEDSADIRGK